MRMRVLAIDQGTSATKALVVEADGSVAAELETPVNPVASSDGGVEQDPEELWQSVVSVGRKALAACGYPTIDIVALSNQGETVMAWDEATGRPIGPALSWQDRRAVDVCHEMRDSADELAQLTGLNLDPYFVAPKIAWLRRKVGRAPRIATTDAWLLQRLCGRAVTDASTASRSLLVDLDTGEYSPRACDLFGIDVTSPPPIVSNDAIVGETTAFGAAFAVGGLCLDQQAALWAEGCVAAGEAKCTYGTGAFMLASTGSRPVRSTAGLVGCVAWSLRGATTWCLDGQVYTVGAAVNWLRSVGLIDQPSDLDAIGVTVPSSGGVQFVPALAGLGSPFWAPRARGAFTGMSLATERAHLIRAVIDGIAAQVAVLGAAVSVDLGQPITRLRVDGGLTRSRLLLQTQADLSQVPIEVYPSPNATALGVASMGRIALGATPAQASLPWQPSAIVAPRISADEAIARLTAWRAAAQATMVL